MSQREKTLLLLGVFLIVCSLALSEWLESPQSPSPPLRVGESLNGAPLLQSALTRNLKAKRTLTLKNPRNIFAPLQAPRAPKPVKALSPVPEHVPLPSPPSASRPTPHQPVGSSPTELAAGQAKEEMRQYRFLGYMTKAGIQQGFLGKGQEIYIVKQGERFKDDLEIKSIGPMEIVLSKHVKQTGARVEAILPLTKTERDTP